jgi:hypothetical protein
MLFRRIGKTLSHEIEDRILVCKQKLKNLIKNKS